MDAAGSRASRAARRCGAPPRPVAPPSTARTASDDAGHVRQLRRRPAAGRTGRYGARHARGVGAARRRRCTPSPGAATRDRARTAHRARAARPLPAAQPPSADPAARISRCRARSRWTGRRADLAAPWMFRWCTPRITPTARRTDAGPSSGCSPGSRHAATGARPWCCRSRSPPPTRCSRWAFPRHASRFCPRHRCASMFPASSTRTGASSLSAAWSERRESLDARRSCARSRRPCRACAASSSAGAP